MQLAIPVARLPISIVLISDGTLAFVRTAAFHSIIDQPTCENCPTAIFTEQGFTIGEDSFDYNVKYLYKECGMMLQWLVAQKLEMPVSNVFGF